MSRRGDRGRRARTSSGGGARPAIAAAAAAGGAAAAHTTVTGATDGLAQCAFDVGDLLLTLRLVRRVGRRQRDDRRRRPTRRRRARTGRGRDRAGSAAPCSTQTACRSLRGRRRHWRHLRRATAAGVAVGRAACRRRCLRRSTTGGLLRLGVPAELGPTRRRIDRRRRRGRCRRRAAPARAWPRGRRGRRRRRASSTGRVSCTSVTSMSTRGIGGVAQLDQRSSPSRSIAATRAERRGAVPARRGRRRRCRAAARGRAPSGTGSRCAGA